VILDIAVPRDFDPDIHDGETTCLFNIDDLRRVCDRTLRERLAEVAPAEALVAEETQRFLRDWTRRRNGPLVSKLLEDFESKRQAVLRELLARLNGRLTDEDRETIEGAFRLLQNQFLHGPISALAREPHEGHRHSLREALRKLFWLED
jgi:glutamyl-tRNA reductase